MHRIDHESATAQNLFTEGDPQQGIPPTTVTDDWLNDIQENIAQFIESQSLVLVKGQHNLLELAIGSAALGAGRVTHVQGSAATQWSITHNFGTVRHFVQIVDTNGVGVEGTVTRGVNNTVIDFAEAQDGEAYLISME